MAKNVHLMTIDPQNDFCITTGPGGEKGTLVVAGGEADMTRLGAFITKNEKRLSEIHSTLDSHQYVHIAHPAFWINSKGKNPDPYTLISVEDVKNGVWRSFNPKWQGRALSYVEDLALDTKDHPKRYILVIWPPHCLIGTWGHAIVPIVANALYAWEKNTFNRVNFVAKGSNLFTEHYSGVQADVPDPTDKSTKLNTALIDTLNEADEILITGEALSHCVANTIRDIATQFGDDQVKKFTLLEDTSSNVTTFEKMGQDFVKDMVKKGMKITNTRDW